MSRARQVAAAATLDIGFTSGCGEGMNNPEVTMPGQSHGYGRHIGIGIENGIQLDAAKATATGAVAAAVSVADAVSVTVAVAASRSAGLLGRLRFGGVPASHHRRGRERDN